jgi:hypothetical protein
VNELFQKLNPAIKNLMGQRKRAFIYAAEKRGKLQRNGLNDNGLG